MKAGVFFTPYPVNVCAVIHLSELELVGVVFAGVVFVGVVFAGAVFSGVSKGALVDNIGVDVDLETGVGVAAWFIFVA